MATVPPTQPGIRIRFTSPYKGGSKEWSNTWYLTGPAWASQTAFNTLADEYVANAKTWVSSNSEIIEAIGTNGGSFLPVFIKTYAQPGILTGFTNGHMPLEAAVLVKGTTDARSTKNHPIYIFKYIHGAIHNDPNAAETPTTGQKSAIQGSANEFVAGVTDGTNLRKWAGPRGAVVQSALVETYVTHRDFP